MKHEEYCVCMPIELCSIAPAVRKKCEFCGCWVGLTQATVDAIKEKDCPDIKFACLKCAEKNTDYSVGLEQLKDLTDKQLEELKNYLNYQ